jgi:ATP-dependent DNA helicase RecG
MGTQQSGALDLLIADLGKDGAILQQAREAANEILTNDPNLEKPENAVIKTQVLSLRKTVVNWSRIS